MRLAKFTRNGSRLGVLMILTGTIMFSVLNSRELLSQVTSSTPNPSPLFCASFQNSTGCYYCTPGSTTGQSGGGGGCQYGAPQAIGICVNISAPTGGCTDQVWSCGQYLNCQFGLQVGNCSPSFRKCYNGQ